uniref:Uncharacterized protein n=1 Tax=Glossina austeni TaxID=7395 RepID=A0A1A9VXZ2_GLOAU
MYKRRALYSLKGAKNGSERLVYKKKPKANYPTKRFVKKRPTKHFFNQHKRNIRRNLKPGTVLILLAGRHQGKRVVLLKSLASSLLLVTGPFAIEKEKTTGESDIFTIKKERFMPNEQRKKDQKVLDAAIIKAIKSHPEAKFLIKYLKNMFALHSSQYPHRMIF